MSARAHLAYARQRARKRFGNDVCAECREADELTLQEFEGRVLCRRCTLLAQGLAPTEDEHPFGKRNSPKTRPMDANDHALLTALQSYWPETRSNHGSPIVTVKAGLRRQADLLVLQREHIDRQAKLLALEREHIDELLVEIASTILSLDRADARRDISADEIK